MPGSPSMPGSIAMTSPSTSASSADRPMIGGSWTSRPTPWPREKWKPRSSEPPGGPGAQGGIPGPLDHLRGGVVEGPSAGSRADQGAGRLERLPHDGRQTCDLAAHVADDERPATCRPSSPRASSCGHRSMLMGRWAGRGPSPGSCPPPDQALATMMSGGAGAPSAAQASRIRARTRSAVRGSPPRVRRSPSTRAAASRAAPAAMPALGGGLRATDARELRGGLDPAAGGEVRGIDAQDDAVGAQPVGDGDG